MSRRGVVIGKFLPPHRGHQFLIDTATAQTDHLTVFVCDNAADTIPAELRATWLREIHPTAHVRTIPDTLPPDDSQAWARYTIEQLGYRPEVVFTSEDYGTPYAAFMGCEHILVDKARRAVPCSGTLIRQRPLDHLHFLEPCVRAYFVLRIAIMGAESTGTTTMAQALAAHYHTLWVPEYGRDYSAEKIAQEGDAPWRTEEFLHIAATQNAWEDERARDANRLLICDTDSFATALWHERYVGSASSDVRALSAQRVYAHTFLTDADIPFVQDGTRDGEAIRPWMHRRFIEELNRSERAYTLLSGDHATRLAKAIEVLDALLR